MAYKILLTTCDKHLWTLRPFSYLFNKYWSSQQEVFVLGESQPPFHLPENFVFKSAGIPWPKEKYTNAVIPFLENVIRDEIFVWLLDDYWLVRTIDHTGISTMIDFMVENPDILRVDLTSDRAGAGGSKIIRYYGHYDIVEAHGSPYQMSLQAGIWRRRTLNKILRNDWSPWDIELQGTSVLNQMGEVRVVGTKQQLVRYANGSKSGSDMISTSGLIQQDIDTLKEIGWIPQ